MLVIHSERGLSRAEENPSPVVFFPLASNPSAEPRAPGPEYSYVAPETKPESPGSATAYVSHPVQSCALRSARANRWPHQHSSCCQRIRGYSTTSPSTRASKLRSLRAFRPRRNGGEAGIRTLGTAFQPYNGLANRRLQPARPPLRQRLSRKDTSATSRPTSPSFA